MKKKSREKKNNARDLQDWIGTRTNQNLRTEKGYLICNCQIEQQS